MNLFNTTPALIVALTLMGTVAAATRAVRTSEIAVKGRANAYPSLAASGRFAAIAWGASTPEGVTDVYVAMNRDGGHTFGAPVRVNQVAGQVRLSGEQPPRITLVARRRPPVDRRRMDRQGWCWYATVVGTLR